VSCGRRLAMTVVLTGLTERQGQSWVGLLDVAAEPPVGQCLIGGQMVHLLRRERRFAESPLRDQRHRGIQGGSQNQPGRGFVVVSS
jgi:hypothetical protein